MKNILLLFLLFEFALPENIFPQDKSGVEVFLITCGPGTETYSIYGHSALRIFNPENNTNTVYNWGVFDFSTPNFVWKFAKGRLDYMLVEETMKEFLQIYLFEERYVNSQKINLEPDEIEKLIALINENLKPENIKYRYDFFYDDCSTRIRDLIEKSINGKVLYPPDVPAEAKEIPTFRKLVGKYQNPYPWLKLGIDLIMGSPGDKEALSKERMFLPIDMQNGLSETYVNRSGKMIPLLQNQEVILDFDPPMKQQNLYSTPFSLFALLLIIVIILTGWLRSSKANNIIDLVLYSVYSILSLLMIFFNYFTDHQQMRWNMNIIWLNPFIILCLIALFLNNARTVWFRIVFIISITFLVLHLFLPQEFNIAVIPLVLILIIRSSARAGFDWNPFSLR
jgi:hypothetical protein